jgi:FAD/FMN-containing dehydrogenase
MRVSALVTVALTAVGTYAAPNAAPPPHPPHVGPGPGGPWPPLVPRADLRAVLTDPANSFSANTTVSFPGDGDGSAFTAATARWSLFAPPTYSAAITPGTEQDVVTAVRLARRNNVNFLATGGRHGYTSTLARMTDGLAIDLGRMRSVSVNQRARTLTVGPGVVFGDIFQPLYDAGLQIQTGVCSCPGMVGVTIGSGVGRFEGIYGLVADALASVRLVTANGTLITASRTQNSDLFWGIRGAGANFGVIVSATYNVHPLYRGGQYTVLDFMLPAEANTSYFNILEGFMGGNRNLPADLSVSTVMLFNETSGRPQIMANWVFAGPEAEARTRLAAMFRLPSMLTAVNQVPWSQLTATAVFGLDPQICSKGQNITILGANLRRIETSTLSELFRSLLPFYQQNPAARGSTVTIESFPVQGTTSYADDSSAYPWRDVKSLVMFQPVAAGAAKQPAFDFMSARRRALAARSGYSGYDGLRTYVNYSQGNERLEQIFGANKLPRLARLKRQWDPTNVFRYNNPLPTQYP